MSACIDARHEPLEQLLLAEHDHRLVPDARGDVVGAVERLRRADEPHEEERATREQPARDGEQRRERDARRRASLWPSHLPELGRDRGDDLVQVADHRVVGVREDRRLGIVVDREQRLRALAAGDVLRRAADPARDVEVGRDLRARLADLVGVRPPAGARDDARAADRAVEQRRELLEDREALARPDAAPAGDDDLRVGERDLAARVGRDVLDDSGRASPSSGVTTSTSCGSSVRARRRTARRS